MTRSLAAGPAPWTSGLSDKDFARFSRLIRERCGIKMPPQKKSMLEARLRKRLRVLGMNSYEQYAEFLFSGRGMAEELVHMTDVVTTNKTDFFREPAHYELLREEVLPCLVREFGTGVRRELRVWSAGCATGEEPYTLAMVCSEFAQQFESFEFSILATDLSTLALEKARSAIYRMDRLAPVPENLKKKYFLRSKDRQKNLARVCPALRSRVSFRQMNFMDEDFDVQARFDLIFCRNVIIYFERPTQERLLRNLCGHLAPQRYLFMGHSESLNGLVLPLTQVAPAAYRKT